jgi:hypothetical protein
MGLPRELQMDSTTGTLKELIFIFSVNSVVLSISVVQFPQYAFALHFMH